MKILYLTFTFLTLTVSTSLAQVCINPGYDITLDNSVKTIKLNGDCEGPFDTSIKNFEYSIDTRSFSIQTRFSRNCARTGYITVQANETEISIVQHTVGDGPLATCEDYDMYQLFFPSPPQGYYRITYNNACDTIVSISTDVEKYNLSKQVKVFPNPARDVINISELTGNNEIVIYNKIGVAVHRNLCSSDSYTINTSELKSGIYFLHITDKDSKEIRHREKVLIK